ncbi:unnamed protein product [Peniophora sp. CBMAI 1063]|nr:unnamed protein product [Peniophora sp. CBMAI 1063]
MHSSRLSCLVLLALNLFATAAPAGKPRGHAGTGKHVDASSKESELDACQMVNHVPRSEEAICSNLLVGLKLVDPHYTTNGTGDLATTSRTDVAQRAPEDPDCVGSHCSTNALANRMLATPTHEAFVPKTATCTGDACNGKAPNSGMPAEPTRTSAEPTRVYESRGPRLARGCPAQLFPSSNHAA